MKTIKQLEDDLESAHHGMNQGDIEAASAELERGRVWWVLMKPAIDHLKSAKEDCDYAGTGGEGMEEVGLKIGTALSILESFDC